MRMAPARARLRLNGLRNRLSDERDARLQRIARSAWRRRNPDLPPITNVQIQTHSRCNADCVFCPYVESWHAANPGRMSEELFGSILEQLRPFAPLIERGRVSPYLMQEPLLDRRIYDWIERIYAAFPGTMVEISTNGAALSPRAVEELIRVLVGRRHEIWISHHGVDAESLDRVMRVDHRKATGNVVELLRRAEGRLRVRIQGAGRSLDGRIHNFGEREYRRSWAETLVREGVPLRNVSVTTFRFHDRAGAIRRTDRDAHLNNKGVVRRIDADNPFHCDRVGRWLHVMWDGRLRICCMDYHGEVPLPSLDETPLLDILRSERYAELMGQVTGAVESPGDFICKRCTSPGG